MIIAPKKGDYTDRLWVPVSEVAERLKAFESLTVKGTGLSGRLHVASTQFILELARSEIVGGGGVQPPIVTSVSPNHGPAAGGTSVHVFGSGFLPTPTQVRFQFEAINGPPGSTMLSGVVWVSWTELTGFTPAHLAGVVNVVVKNPDGLEGGGVGLYTYDAAPWPSNFHLAGLPNPIFAGQIYNCTLTDTTGGGYSGGINLGWGSSGSPTVQHFAGGGAGLIHTTFGPTCDDMPSSITMSSGVANFSLRLHCGSPHFDTINYGGGQFAGGGGIIYATQPGTGATATIDGSFGRSVTLN